MQLSLDFNKSSNFFLQKTLQDSNDQDRSINQ